MTFLWVGFPYILYRASSALKRFNHKKPDSSFYPIFVKFSLVGWTLLYLAKFLQETRWGEPTNLQCFCLNWFENFASPDLRSSPWWSKLSYHSTPNFSPNKCLKVLSEENAQNTIKVHRMKGGLSPNEEKRHNPNISLYRFL